MVHAPMGVRGPRTQDTGVLWSHGGCPTMGLKAQSKTVLIGLIVASSFVHFGRRSSRRHFDIETC